MSTASRRRNGSQASCERCRKSKIRCDHLKPICGPCQRRGLESQCWYHPAPLTKRRNSRSTPPTHPQADSIDQDEFNHDTSETNPVNPFSDFLTWPSILNHPNYALSRVPIYESLNEKGQQGHLATTEEIVAQLKYLPFIEKLFDEFFSFSQIALVPRRIFLRLVKSVRNNLTISEQNPEKTVECGHGISQLAKDVLHSSSSQVNITSSLDPDSFCALFSGNNLRVETLGLLYTTAARSYLCGMVYDESKHDGFIQAMIRCSNLSLQLARDLSTQTNDFIIWLAHDNLQLTTLVEGEPSLGVWRRLGDLATDLFALGLHRESTYSTDTTPFFLAECRRKTFATAYHNDKFFMAVFNRPPRIPARFVDFNLPLDLSEDEIFATSSEMLEQARSKLSLDGWGTDGGYRATTWARFQLLRLLGQGDITPQPELIQVSANMLETVIRMAKARSRAIFFPRDLPVLVLSYGLPSAMVLIAALRETTQSPSTNFPLEVNRSRLIRNLSVFVSQLDSISSPKETTHEFCIQAAKIISRKLDMVLDNLAVSTHVEPLDVAPGSNESPKLMPNQPIPANGTSTPGSASLETINFDDMDGLDLDSWPLSFDFDAINNEWNTP
ncbi:uncharacterized protein GGS22DRAFT_195046 [Annulohypoxylon maeteangense]|uniref:uncharacterized protein n=1 Tax=Annulohypoxylon maeteangense TaxID=1927788 RepID=UPI002007DB10|nr:uncharacterized protein GGS22DRAFT_195046 [Annulohypoxylon maeteangense]KAI0883873.1 hypothetical protein GGS22DRAFT_195046 [Annulohypoxylon maeteangense]